MLTLYIKTGCPYCAMVLKKIDDLGLEVEEKNTSDPEIVAELIELGGKKQTPFLLDSERDVKMYESAAIADYLDENYGGSITTPSTRLHRGNDENVCEAGE